MRRAALAAVAVALLTTACGTTVKNADAVGTANGGLTSGDSGQPATGDSGLSLPSAGSATSTVTAADGSAGTTTGTTSTTGSTTAPLAVGGSAAAQVQGIGITGSTISVGVTYSTGNDEANRALGNNLTTGDQKADAQAVIDDINAHGGVAGRKMMPVWYDYQTTDARPYTTIDNEACAHFTQDNHVFAVAGDGITDNFASCVTKAGAMMVSSASQIIGPDQAYFNRYPYVFNVGYLTQDRMMAEEVRSLVRQNWFTGWNASTGNPASAVPAKLGIMSFDTPNWNTPLDRVMLPALKSAGHPVDPNDVERVAYPSGTNGIGNTVAQIQSAVLRFRQDGVTHVIVLDGNGSMTLHMLNNMRSQHYYPRLGVNSASGVETLATQYHEDAQSFNGAVGLGWLPILDLPAGKGDTYFTSHTQDCIHMIEKRTGQHFGDTNAASIALGYCDQLHLLADAINGAGRVVNRDTASAVIEALGARFPAAGTRGVFFSPGRHDGIEFGYDLRFDMSCRCTKYVSDPFRIP